MGFKDQRNTQVQAALNQFGCLLKVDGDIGPRSLASIEAYEQMCLSPFTYVMETALCGGKCSGFGGPNDSGDRLEWQAYLPYVDKTKVSPCEYWEKYGEILPKDAYGEYLLNKEAMLTANVWPKTTGVGGVPGTAGLSFFLNDKACFGAIRAKGVEMRRLISATKLLRMMVVNQKTGESCIIMITDYGPHTSTGRNIDLSQGALAKASAVTDDILVFYLLQD